MGKKKKNKKKSRWEDKKRLNKIQIKAQKDLKKAVRKDNRIIIGVDPCEHNQYMYYYTLGNTIHNRPEIITFFPGEVPSYTALEEISDAMLADKNLTCEDGDFEILINEFFYDKDDNPIKVAVRYIDPESIQHEHILSYVRGTDLMKNPRYIQVIIADEGNKFPDEPGADKMMKENTPPLFF